MLDKQNTTLPRCPSCQSYNTKQLGTACRNCDDFEVVPNNYFCHGCQSVFYFKAFENKMDHSGKENKGQQAGP